MDKLFAMRVFAAVVADGGFSAAARRLNLAKSAVSTTIKSLEAELGVALLNRTTRTLSLTEAGRRYKERTDQILADVAEADLEAASLTQVPRGILRVSAGVSFGISELAPVVTRYMATYPDVSIELNLADRYVDLVEEGFDVAIRIGDLSDSSLIAKRLTTSRRMVCAAPSYLEQYGTPKHPTDLKHHKCLYYNLLARGGAWPFQENGQDFTVPIRGTLSANNGDVLRQAAIGGVGVIFAPSFIFADALRSGALVHILADYEPTPTTISAIYPPNRHVSAKLRAFIDMMTDYCGELTSWEKGL